MRAPWVALALLALATGVVGRVPTARADAEELDRRLVAAGIDPALRLEIRAGIEKAVAFLARAQRADGWCGTKDDLLWATHHDHEPGTGSTLLVALALRHAGGPVADEAVAKAVDWLFERDAARAAAIGTRVYTASVALMLLASVPGYRAQAKTIASSLCAAVDDATGWWGYDTPGPATARRAPFHADTPNLSTTQFAVLGLRAAQLSGIDVPASTWTAVARSLCRRQRSDGGWSYKAVGGFTRHPARCTAVGLSILQLSRAATARDEALASDASKAIQKAEGVLRHEGRNFIASLLAPPETKPWTPPPYLEMAAPGFGWQSALFAIEEACLFSDIDLLRDLTPPIATRGLPVADERGASSRDAVPGERWYADGARWLLSQQQADGSWWPLPTAPRDQFPCEIDTAFALLFLTRAPSTLHPTTPSPVDAKPRGPITREPPQPPSK